MNNLLRYSCVNYVYEQMQEWTNTCYKTACSNRAVTARPMWLLPAETCTRMRYLRAMYVKHRPPLNLAEFYVHGLLLVSICSLYVYVAARSETVTYVYMCMYIYVDIIHK